MNRKGEEEGGREEGTQDPHNFSLPRGDLGICVFLQPTVNG